MRAHNGPRIKVFYHLGTSAAASPYEMNRRYGWCRKRLHPYSNQLTVTGQPQHRADAILIQAAFPLSA